MLCNYNSIHKMEPESFTVFMNILRRRVYNKFERLVSFALGLQ